MVWWKIYFWVILALTIISPSIILARSPNLMDLAGIIGAIIFTVAVYTFAFKKGVLARESWKSIFWIMVIFWGVNAIYELILPTGSSVKESLSFLEGAAYKDMDIGVAEKYFDFLLGLPAFYAIYKLGHEKAPVKSRKRSK